MARGCGQHASTTRYLEMVDSDGSCVWPCGPSDSGLIPVCDSSLNFGLRQTRRTTFSELDVSLIFCLLLFWSFNLKLGNASYARTERGELSEDLLHFPYLGVSVEMETHCFHYLLTFEKSSHDYVGFSWSTRYIMFVGTTQIWGNVWRSITLYYSFCVLLI